MDFTLFPPDALPPAPFFSPQPLIKNERAKTAVKPTLLKYDIVLFALLGFAQRDSIVRTGSS
jgi:hypothetical protein